MNARDYQQEHIREYVELEAPDETVTHLEHVAARHLFGDHYEIWDVWTDKNRWWVIFPLMNFYLQSDFQSMDMAYTYHLGVLQVLSARDREIPVNEKTRALEAWRKWDQAAEKLDEAREPEDFQAVGMRLREGLVAFTRALMKPEYIPAGVDTPEDANFIRWSELIADFVAFGTTGVLRDPAHALRDRLITR